MFEDSPSESIIIGTDGTLIDVTIKITRFSGKTALLFENGSPYGVLITGVDVTSRIQMEELNRSQNQRLIGSEIDYTIATDKLKWTVSCFIFFSMNIHLKKEPDKRI
ncbi:MAG: hypothetical protein GX640_02585 [Fibrobacter sp.]|nr:hypothetical protein [Fibrobacter sp.]